MSNVTNQIRQPPINLGLLPASSEQILERQPCRDLASAGLVDHPEWLRSSTPELESEIYLCNSMFKPFFKHQVTQASIKQSLHIVQGLPIMPLFRCVSSCTVLQFHTYLTQYCSNFHSIFIFEQYTSVAIQ